MKDNDREIKPPHLELIEDYQAILFLLSNIDHYYYHIQFYIQYILYFIYSWLIINWVLYITECKGKYSLEAYCNIEIEMQKIFLFIISEVEG